MAELKTKLWLDDFRFPPSDEWEWVKTFDEFVEVAPTQEWEHMSLDHDLDDFAIYSSRDSQTWDDWLHGYYVGGKNGMDVTRWIVENECWPTKSIAIHTDVTDRREAMAELIDSHGPFESFDWYERDQASGMTYAVRGYIFYASEENISESSETGSTRRKLP
jgi:hypothetical protein